MKINKKFIIEVIIKKKKINEVFFIFFYMALLVELTFSVKKQKFM